MRHLQGHGRGLFSRRASGRLAVVAAVLAVSAASGLASAATVNLATSDTPGQSSFTTDTLLHWNPAGSPVAGNTYTVAGGLVLRDVADSTGTITFAGDALNLGDGTTTGTLTFKNATNATVSVNNLTLNNGELQAGGTSSGGANVTTITGNGITLGTNGGRLNTGNTGRGLIVGSNIGGSGALAVSGSGAATLTGTNAYTGGTSVSGAGTVLNLGNGGTTGTLGSGTITLNASVSNGELLFNRSNTVTQGTDFGLITGAGNVGAVGGGTIILNQANTYGGGTTIGVANSLNTAMRATVAGAFGTGTIGILGNGTVNTSAGGRLELANNVSLSNAVILSAKFAAGIAGVESVSGNNTLSNTVTLTTGGNFYTIQADDAASVFTVGTAGSAAITAGALTGSRAITLQGDGNGNIAGNIVGSTAAGATSPVTKAGNGTWTLSGANTYVGDTTVSGGTLVAASSTALGTGAANVTAGTLKVAGGVNVGGLTGLTVADGATLSLNAASELTLASGNFALGNITLDLNNAYNALGTYTLIDGVGTSNTLGAVTFANTNPSYHYALALSGGGDNAVLTVTSAVPEPASLGFLGLAAVGFLRRRRSIV